jgi:hypothetical protein
LNALAGVLHDGREIFLGGPNLRNEELRDSVTQPRDREDDRNNDGENNRAKKDLSGQSTTPA